MTDFCSHCSTRFDRFGRCDSCDALKVACDRHHAAPGVLCNGGSPTQGHALCSSRRMDGAARRAA